MNHCSLTLYLTRCGVVVIAMAALIWTASAAAPIKITIQVASPADLTVEIDALLTAIQESTKSTESYSEHQTQLKRQSIQIAVFAQTLAEHEIDSPLKKSAPSLRNASLSLVRSTTFDEATQAVARISEAMEGKHSGTPAVEIEWNKLARASAVMPLLKERSEAVRKGLRRPKDAEIESRNAMAMAVLALTLHGDTHLAKTPADKTAWQDYCLEVQSHMSQAAAAIKTRDASAVDHFRMGMEACDKCHQKFKP